MKVKIPRVPPSAHHHYPSLLLYLLVVQQNATVYLKNMFDSPNDNFKSPQTGESQPQFVAKVRNWIAARVSSRRICRRGSENTFIDVTRWSKNGSHQSLQRAEIRQATKVNIYRIVEDLCTMYTTLGESSLSFSWGTVAGPVLRPEG